MTASAKRCSSLSKKSTAIFTALPDGTSELQKKEPTKESKTVETPHDILSVKRVRECSERIRSGQARDIAVFYSRRSSQLRANVQSGEIFVNPVSYLV